MRTIATENDWRPGAGIQALRARAGMLAIIRAFFAENDVMEVVTPVLGAAGVTDVHIENLTLAHRGRQYFLQTSPEYAMKRLLAASSGPVYQICPAFRGAELGPRHNIEFTMLEWYRPGYSLQELMAEVEAVVSGVARHFNMPLPSFKHERYKDLFLDRYQCDPHKANLEQLAEIAKNESRSEAAHLTDGGDRNDYLDLLFSEGIEQALQQPVFIREYPSTQAMLATTNADDEGQVVADRFELFIHGVELANGFFELTEPDTLRARFEDNNRKRAARGLPEIPVDAKLLDAMPAMPQCAGVAMGLDRLLMLVTGSHSLDEVMPFTETRL